MEARQVGRSFSRQSCSPHIVSSPHCRPTIRPCRVVYKVPCRKSSSAVQVRWLPAQKSLFRLCFMRHFGLFSSTLASTGDGTQVSSGRRNRLVNILLMTFVNMTCVYRASTARGAHTMFGLVLRRASEIVSWCSCPSHGVDHFTDLIFLQTGH